MELDLAVIAWAIFAFAGGMFLGSFFEGLIIALIVAVCLEDELALLALAVGVSVGLLSILFQGNNKTVKKITKINKMSNLAEPTRLGDILLFLKITDADSKQVRTELITAIKNIAETKGHKSLREECTTALESLNS